MKLTPEIRSIIDHVNQAQAGLVALSNYRHDGRQLPNAEKTLERALTAAIAAGRLAESLTQRQPTHRNPPTAIV